MIQVITGPSFLLPMIFISRFVSAFVSLGIVFFLCFRRVGGDVGVIYPLFYTRAGNRFCVLFLGVGVKEAGEVQKREGREAGSGERRGEERGQEERVGRT